MTLGKTSALNGVAVVVSILTAIGLNKVLALYIGPAGYAVVGQFANIVAMLSAVTGGVISTAVTKCTAEFHDVEDRQRAVWRAASRYLFASTALTALIVAVFSEQLAIMLLGAASYRVTLIALAAVLPLLSLNTLLLAIMNGKKEVTSFVLQGMASTLVGASTSAVLAIRFGLPGALFAIVLNALWAMLLTMWICRRSAWATARSFLGPVSWATYRPLLGFAAMALTSAVVAPLGQVAVRDHLINQFGQVAAGEWQAVFKISEMYVQMFTATLALYYLPRLAEIRHSVELWHEIRKVCVFVLPLAAGAALTIYVFREWITLTLFTAEFIGMIYLFGWQLIGDVLKVAGWIFGFVMVGRAMVRGYIALEIVFGALWVGLTIVMTAAHGIVGAPMAFALNYAAYGLVCAAMTRRELSLMKP